MPANPGFPPLPPVPGVPLRVADHLSDLIIRGELRPGAHVPEKRITTSLGVSRGSVREALQILARRHLVDLQPRRGAVVCAFDEDITRDLYDLLIPLYTALTQLLARRWREPQELEVLGQLVAEMRACAGRGDALAVIDLSARFTETGCAMLGNDFLTAALRDLRPVFNRSYYRVLSRGAVEYERLCEFTAALVTMIGRRDGAGLDKIVREYGEHQLQQIVDTF